MCSRSAYEEGSDPRSAGGCANGLLSECSLWRLPEGLCVHKPLWQHPTPPPRRGSTHSEALAVEEQGYQLPLT